MSVNPHVPSDRKREAGHINGLKSAGAKTPEGLAASSQNARTHGLTALRPILSVEEIPHFDALYHDWAASLKPQNGLERQTLQDIVEVHWELRRLRDVDRANIEMTICLRRDTVDQQWESISPHGRIADAMSHLANTSKFPSQMNRQLNRLSREQDRLIKHFHQLRRDCPPIVDPPPNSGPEVKNEGNPISEHQPENRASNQIDLPFTTELPANRAPLLRHRPEIAIAANSGFSKNVFTNELVDAKLVVANASSC